MSRVTLFLSDEKDAEDYKRIPLKKVVTAAQNVAEKFNAIHNHYEAGTAVFLIEDDVRLVRQKKTSSSVEALLDFNLTVSRGLSMIKNGGIFGVAPHDNGPRFQKKDTDGILLVAAHAFGFISTKKKSLEVTQICKSDYERTCLYLESYGGVARLGGVGVQHAESYTSHGGVQAEMTFSERKIAESASCDYLIKRFPNFLLPSSKPSHFRELSFRRIGGIHERK